jgi:hypothetical protein
MIPFQSASQITTAPLLTETGTPPAPLGIVFFGLTFLLFNLYSVGLFPLNPLILAMGVFYGAIGQILIGIMEWRHNRIFGATAFTAFGLFWLSLIALTILPRAGYGELPEAAAMTAYFGIWCLFTFIFLVATFQFGRSLQIVFAGFFLYLLLCTTGAFGIGSFGAVAAGYEGILGGVTAIYTGIALAINRRVGAE